MDNQPNTNTQSRTPRWIKILLTLSLAVNLLIIGAGVGIGLRVKSFTQDGAGGPRGGFAFVAALEREDRRALMKQTRESRRESHREGRASMRDILAVLRAKDFDPAALETALNAQKTRNSAMQDSVSSSLIAQIGDMSADERAAYADRLEAHLQRGGKKKGKKPKRQD